jgi:hypothetical protein
LQVTYPESSSLEDHLLNQAEGRQIDNPIVTTDLPSLWRELLSNLPDGSGGQDLIPGAESRCLLQWFALWDRKLSLRVHCRGPGAQATQR